MMRRRSAILVIGITSIAFIIASIPYVFGYLSVPPGKKFMGMVINVADHAQYFAWLRGFRSAHVIPNVLTSEPNPPVFFNLLWWSLAQVSRATKWDYSIIYQVLRFGSAALVAFAAFSFCSRYFEHYRYRFLCLLTFLFSGGFGWVLIVLKHTLHHGVLYHPLDVYIAEPNTFLCLMGYPHFSLALGLMVICFLHALKGQRTGRIAWAVSSGSVALLLGLQHAYDLITIYGVLAFFGLLLWLRDRKIPVHFLKTALIVGIISAPPAVYSFVLTARSPIWQEVLSQFGDAGVYTPAPLHLVILLGPALLFALITALLDRPFRLATQSDDELFLRAWFWGSFLLVYVPTDFQVHMLNGWQLPIAILSVRALRRLVAWQRSRLACRPACRLTDTHKARWAALLFVLLIVPTNVYLLAWRLVDLNRGAYPYYLYQDEVAAMEWLAQHADVDDVVLSSLTTGQYFPMISGTRAIIAHWASTVDFATKRELVSRFFSTDSSDIDRLRIIDDLSVDYVFYGPLERSLGAFDPGASDLFEPVLDSRHVSLYATLAK